ncbi:hypothetical protein, partial [Bacillus cereus]
KEEIEQKVLTKLYDKITAVTDGFMVDTHNREMQAIAVVLDATLSNVVRVLSEALKESTREQYFFVANRNLFYFIVAILERMRDLCNELGAGFNVTD